ncbi:hypothetical protein [Actinomadura fibrosa]|uniref:Secreted protein n=1 Tax=Actinomadura fibrosa TaxID=111802 RepID=A0ABW2XVP8_9ACTN|nr:hypothetical protein [Actinomadura fibrosa]
MRSTIWLGTAVLAAALVLPAGAARAAGAWTASPATGVSGPVSSHGDTDAWALGSPGFAHWNGTSWQQVPAPAGRGTVLAISAGGPAGTWAVGKAAGSGYRVSSPQIERWDGSAWSIVPSPAISARNAALHGVAAVGPADAWAVGTDGRRALVEHWDGTAWSRVAVPEEGAPFSSRLAAVSARSATDVWAVGTHSNDAPQPDSLYALHYDGSAWSVVPMAQTGSQTNSDSPVATGAVAVAANDVWAVGYRSGFGTPVTLTEHWDGSRWTIVPSPYDHLPPSANSIASGSLAAVTARSSHEVWAGGSSFTFTDGDPAGVYHALLIRWDGTRWTEEPAPTTGTYNAVQGISTTLGGGVVWATNAGTPNLLVHP